MSNSSITLMGSASPNFWRNASFFVRSNGLKAMRVLRDFPKTFDTPSRSHTLLPFVTAESVTPLRYVRQPDERVFEEGKIKNLKLACDRLTGLIIEPSGEFSFWRNIGRPSKGNGFAVGREIREGCLIPTVGGGLCQLSGSLYSVATQCGFTIVERHSHTRRLQDAYFDESRDATVFWNYVDLRFLSAMRFQLETFLTAQDLVVRLRTEEPMGKISRDPAFAAATTPFVSDCLTCGRDDCHQSHRTRRFLADRRQTVLADRLSPEFHRFLKDRLKARDVVLSPYRRATPFADQDPSLPIDVTTFPWTRLKRSALSRFGSRRKIGAWVRISGARLLARRYETEIAQRANDYLFIEQELLPHLWMRGALSGRKFCVLASRLPASVLQRRLDTMYASSPDRHSLCEYRIGTSYSEAEDQALIAADRVVSPHEEVVKSILDCIRIPWEYPKAAKQPSAESEARPTLLFFPGVTAAREGAYEMREAALELGLSLVAFEKNIERPSFWDGVDVSLCSTGSIPWDRISAVVHPAAFISNPRVHLRALASGIPVLASRGCGLPPERVIEVEMGAPQELIQKIRNCVGD